MKKEVYIFRGQSSEGYSSFIDRMLVLADRLLEQWDPDAMKVSMTTRRPPGISIIPFKKDKIAVFSLKGRKQESSDFLSEVQGYAGGHLVEEAIPVAYEKTWEDGNPTPGECLLTLFQKKRDLDYEVFIRRWHEGHTPLSLKLHPLWNYVRNVVKQKSGEQGVWYDGIVEEQFKKSSHLLNPCIFFGPPLKVPVHMYQVFADTRSFIDMKRIETYLATEIHFLSDQKITNQ